MLQQIFWYTAVFFIAFTGVVYHLRARSPLSPIPGPSLARWSALWLIYHARLGRRFIEVDNAHKRYGAVILISPNHVSIADKDALSIVYGQGAHALDKSEFYDGFVCNGRPSIFSTRNRQEHGSKRHLVSHAFSTTSLRQFAPIIQQNATKFFAVLDALSGDGGCFDILHYFHYFAFDVLSDLVFGEPIGMVERGSDIVTSHGAEKEKAIELVDNREHLAAVVGLHPALRTRLAGFIPDAFFSSGKKATSGLEALAARLLKKRIETGSHRDDILSKLIQARADDSSALMAEQIDELTAECVTLLIAGSDTTSNSITAILFYVVKHPEVHKKLVEALESVLCSNELPNQADVERIPYLEATINEGLRMHSTTAFGLPRTVSSRGLQFKGHYFPPGTEISVPAWTIQHDEKIWGDPETFRPERWLQSSDIKPYLLTFGRGPRACNGRNLAYIEMSLVIATIIMRYDIELRSPDMPTTEGFMHKPLSLVVRMRRRF